MTRSYQSAHDRRRRVDLFSELRVRDTVGLRLAVVEDDDRGGRGRVDDSGPCGLRALLQPLFDGRDRQRSATIHVETLHGPEERGNDA